MKKGHFTPNEITYLDDNTIEIKLTQGKTCLIDYKNYDLIKNHRWYYAKSSYENGYAQTLITIGDRRKVIQMHRIILSNILNNELKIDHINLNGCDNRESNLRTCTIKENCRNVNKHRDNKSGYKGVFKKKGRNKYCANIRFNGKLIHIGYFDTSEDAARAYDAAAIELFGEFAKTNF